MEESVQFRSATGRFPSEEQSSVFSKIYTRMWCSKCQVDVPVVACHAHGPLVCPTCRLQLANADPARPGDSGIALDSFDVQAPKESMLAADLLAEQESQQRFKRIGRQLRFSSVYQPHRPTQPSMSQAPPALMPEIQLKSVSHHAARASRNAKTSWLVSLLLLGGMVAFGGGMGILVWAGAFKLAQVWQWGVALTIAAEGMLILGLTGMATRLWRNSRRLNRQLSGVDAQLLEIQQQTGALTGSRLSASQHYYNHFNQVASPHYLVANLRGQVDQLAARMVDEG